MNQEEPSSGSNENDWPDWVKNWVIPYVTEELMWPVLFALWAHFVMAMAVVLVFGWRENVYLGAALVFLMLSGCVRMIWFEIQVKKRPGWVLLSIVLTWIMAIVVGYYGAQYNII